MRFKFHGLRDLRAEEGGGAVRDIIYAVGRTRHALNAREFVRVPAGLEAVVLEQRERSVV